MNHRFAADWLIAFFLLVMGTAVGAPITFVTDPPCEVWALIKGEEVRVGVSGRAIELDTLTGGRIMSVTVIFRKPGYRDCTRLLPANPGGRYPAQGAVRLDPLPPSRMGWWLLVLPALGLMALLVRRRGAEAPYRIRQVGRYEVLEEAGRGGMATVYRARQGETVVALKVVRPELSADPTFRARFSREVRVGQRLTHPHIVQELDAGEENGVLYMVTEWLTGTSLRNRIGEPWPLSEVRDVMLPLMDAIAYAHEQGVVHRDLKPENIILLEDGTPKVLDFGLARDLQMPTISISGEAMGTLSYMAPERFKGRDKEPASDQFALGVIIFEMLTGFTPFDADTLDGRMVPLLEGRPADVLKFRPDIPRALADCVHRMLAHKPEHRYPTLRAALGSFKSACP